MPHNCAGLRNIYAEGHILYLVHELDEHAFVRLLAAGLLDQLLLHNAPVLQGRIANEGVQAVETKSTGLCDVDSAVVDAPDALHCHICVLAACLPDCKSEPRKL